MSSRFVIEKLSESEWRWRLERGGSTIARCVETFPKEKLARQSVIDLKKSVKAFGTKVEVEQK